VLDLVTGFVLFSAAVATVTVVLLYVWLRNRRHYGSLFWAAAFASLAAGSLLIGARGQITDLLSIHLGNALMLFGFALLLAGIASVNREPLRLVFLLPLGIWLVGMAAPQFAGSVAFRMVLYHEAALVAYALMAWSLWRSRRRSPARLMLFHLSAASTVTSAVIITAVVLWPPEDFLTYGLGPYVLIAGTMALMGTVLVGGRLLNEDADVTLTVLAETDDLTGVLNRRGVARRFAALRNKAGQPLVGALMFDLDHFKRINDAHGHAVGDQALVHFAAVARAHLRDGDIFGRLGGEEFCAILAVSSAGEAVAVAERIQAALKAVPLVTAAGHVGVTVSTGVCVEPAEGATLEALLTAADAAMYRAKSRGRDCIVADVARATHDLCRAAG
jgi:diguanylate cyclase (GGDEF) domain